MGCPHPDYLLEFLSSRQLAEWWEYYGMEPFGWVADNWRAGLVASTIANVNRGKSRRAFKPTDFMPKPPDDTPPAKKLRDSLKHLVVKNGR